MMYILEPQAHQQSMLFPEMNKQQMMCTLKQEVNTCHLAGIRQAIKSALASCGIILKHTKPVSLCQEKQPVLFPILQRQHHITQALDVVQAGKAGNQESSLPW